MARMTPEARARLEAFKAVKVKHPRLEDVDRIVTQAIEEPAGATHLLLYGPTGVGKSTVAKRLTERFVTAERDRAVVPVIWVEARPSEYGSLCAARLLSPGPHRPPRPCRRARSAHASRAHDAAAPQKSRGERVAGDARSR
jgi:hypothetical protein